MPWRKKVLRRMILLFFFTLLVLTFMSNTIQGMSLPKVAVEKPDAGSLDLNVSGDGFLEAAQTAQLYAEGDWKVERIHADKNDRVKKGDPLISFDTSSTERTLQDERTRYEQMKLQLEAMGEQMKLLLRSDDTAGIGKQRRELQSQELDMLMQQRKIADLEQQIAAGRTLKAPIDGILTALHASEGADAGRGQPIAEIADDAPGYRFSIVADSSDASPLRIGDEVDVMLDETPPRSVPGTISGIEDAESGGQSRETDDTGRSGKRITVDVKAPGLQPGLKASVSITHQSSAFGMHVPKSALSQDNDGYYVFTVTEKDGPLGLAYYVSKTYITIKDENEDTVVVEGLMPDDKYVTETSEPISDGDRVRY